MVFTEKLADPTYSPGIMEDPPSGPEKKQRWGYAYIVLAKRRWISDAFLTSP
jgi:hypothetical protein